MTDYFFRYLEIVKSSPRTSNKKVIKKSVRPDEIVSDNAGQFTSAHFKEFAQNMDSHAQ